MKWVCHIEYGRVIACSREQPHIFCKAMANLGEEHAKLVVERDGICEIVQLRPLPPQGLWALIKRGWL